MKKKETGSIFASTETTGALGTYLASPKGGLTKREFFAALAMQGILSRGRPEHEVASEAVWYADQLIKALGEGSERA